MTNEQKWLSAQRAAKEIVARYRGLLPEGAVLVAGGGGKSDVDTGMERIGSSRQTTSFNLPAAISSMVESQAGQGVSPGLASGSQSFLTGLVNRDATAAPGWSYAQPNLSLDPRSFDGAGTLRATAERNPWDGAYEAATAGLYQQRAADALSQAGTGQAMVRGGQQRTGIAQGVMSERLAQGRGAEVRGAQMQDAALQQGASQTLNAIEGQRRGTQLGAQQQYAGQVAGREQVGIAAVQMANVLRQIHQAALEAAARLQGTGTQLTSDDLKGKGYQASTNSSWNLLGGICYIALAAFDGMLPEKITWRRLYWGNVPEIRRGYLRMAKWLVPAMERRPALKPLVRFALMRMTKVCEFVWRFTGKE